MTDIMFRFIEQSLTMSLAILLMLLLIKILGDKVRPAKRHICYVIVFVALLIPYRPGILTVPALQDIPVPEAQNASIPEAYLPYHNQERSIDAAFVQTRELMYNWNRFRTGTAPVFGRDVYPVASYATIYHADGYTYANRAFWDAATSLWHSITIHQLFFIIWVTGVLALLAVFAIKHIRFVITLKRHSLHIESGPAYEALRRIRRSLKLGGNIRFMSNPIITVPMVYGLLRPIIVLPEYDTHIDENKLSLFILHEALHIKRRDIATKALSTAALAIHWFNPLVHLLYRRLNEECERACDEAVITFMGTENRLNYSQTLLFAARQSHGRKTAALSYALTSDGKRMKNRLINIMNNTTPKRWVILTCTALLLMVVMGLSLVSCSSGESEQPNDEAYTQQDTDETTQTTGTSQTASQHPFYGETLTISVIFDTFLRDKARAYMNLNPGVTIELINFSGDWERALEQTRIQLMTGEAPVMMDSAHVDIHDPSVTRFLTDWFPILDAEPSFNEEDFFMNVFHGLAVNNQLFAFPIAFGGLFAVANNTVPGLAEALAMYDGISMNQLMDLYSRFPHEGTVPMFLEHNFDTSIAVSDNFHRFFDLENRIVDFNNQGFIDFITHTRELTSPHADFGVQTASNVVSAENEAVASQMYYFQFVLPTTYQYFMGFDDQLLFTNATPIVNDDGKLNAYAWRAYALNAQATPKEQALALDFMQFVAGPQSTRMVSSIHTSIFPVNRESLRIAMEGEMHGWVYTFASQHGWRSEMSLEETVDYIVAKFSAIGDMPMVMNHVPTQISQLVHDALSDFNLGLVSAEQTAQDIQNRVSLILMEME